MGMGCQTLLLEDNEEVDTRDFVSHCQSPGVSMPSVNLRSWFRHSS